ncbi:MAG: ABC transporter permease subunit, partial [Anaerolineae bacterium]|nr:ABC transporter permease subunit [Anaerolineae bacterium]
MTTFASALKNTRATSRWMWLLGLLGLLFVVYLLSRTAPAFTQQFPESLYLGVRPRIDAFQDWVIQNRLTHPAFLYVIDPIKSAIDTAVRAAEDALLSLHWAVLVGAFALVGYAVSGWRMALGCAISLLLFGLLGLWEQSMQTLALMLASVVLSLLIGIPLGIACASSDRINKILRPILDGMQTMPAFVYLIPVVLFFGVARVPAVIATLIYAIPPAIRLTNLGIREVQPSAVEAARAFGSTRAQTLFKVLLPLALPNIMAGVNQTIMMALGMVVIAAMVGAGGLGREVYLALQRLQVGAAFEAGLAIVIMAIMLDRLSEALSKIDLTRETNARRKTKVLGYLLLVIGVAVCVYAFQDAFPAEWRLSLRDPIDAAVRWMRDNLFVITGPLSDFLTLRLLNPMRDFLRDVLPWPVVVVAISASACRIGTWKLALGCAVGLLGVGMLGMWAYGMDTLSQVLVTMLVTLLIALPVGVLASQSNTARVVLRPLLDFLQTVPTFVFLVPVIMLFNIGRVPGLIASVLYAVPVGIKLTELGIRQVAPETVEAAKAFGSTRAQTIVKVQLPLARSAIALSINQMIMMVLAMVIISGMVGGAGLGFQAVEGLARSATGQGM